MALPASSPVSAPTPAPIAAPFPGDPAIPPSAAPAAAPTAAPVSVPLSRGVIGVAHPVNKNRPMEPTAMICFIILSLSLGQLRYDARSLTLAPSNNILRFGVHFVTE